jgi:hypothetical protein
MNMLREKSTAPKAEKQNTVDEFMSKTPSENSF